MASISTDKKGNRRIKFYDSEGKQHGIRIGRVDKKTAERLCRDVEELLAARRMGQPVHPQTADNVNRLNGTVRRRFERVGLLEPVAGESPTMALGAFLTAYVAARCDLKRSTVDNLRQAVATLNDYFGADRPLAAINAGDADDFRNWLQTRRKRPLAANTARRLCSRAKQFFRHALKKKLITENPFAGMRGLQVRGNETRRRFITPEVTSRVLGACPSLDWRVIVALCRYGGLRPSEACNLRWEHVDWDRERIRIRCEKTQHHEGREWREIPFFPELMVHIHEAWEAAAAGAEMVVVQYRAHQNLGPVLKKIIAKAGLEVWPKPFQNLRSTRETELAKEYPIHVVCSWLGNTKRVAMEHYLQVTDEDYRRAAAGGGAVAAEAKEPKRTAEAERRPSGPKSGPARSASGGRRRNGAKPDQTADDEIAVLDAWCRSVQSRSTSPDESQSSPSRIRTYNLAVNSRSLYR
jgi:integrase